MPAVFTNSSSLKGENGRAILLTKRPPAERMRCRLRASACLRVHSHRHTKQAGPLLRRVIGRVVAVLSAYVGTLPLNSRRGFI